MSRWKKTRRAREFHDRPKNEPLRIGIMEPVKRIAFDDIPEGTQREVITELRIQCPDGLRRYPRRRIRMDFQPGRPRYAVPGIVICAHLGMIQTRIVPML